MQTIIEVRSTGRLSYGNPNLLSLDKNDKKCVLNEKRCFNMLEVASELGHPRLVNLSVSLVTHAMWKFQLKMKWCPQRVD